ncbi:GMC family oxidoreductase [Acidiphilium iwatense]|uniref:GMC family oxidoreductase N-terminal domain-containing protein n=1 Tax=Acidiphilium iwatense TaxID=768198 RepID=A0ABS9DYJ4_9PROT|nr:GMC family oxidoreductase N-terminal domain-containing protein [Acidiphilium iwatense]MCF3947826.1 GMC family oxidoreductase N-terminal domain-containing protein [Acidiphilium iwatense]
MANRLSADPNTSVCLLEAGKPDNSLLIDTPLGVAGLLKFKTYNWYYYTESQERLNGRKLYWPRGKTLGGSSSINAMVYIRGNPRDYDEWESLGAPGWGWDQMFPMFKQLERNERGASAFHGGSGEMNVTDLSDPNPLTAAFIKAGVEAGLTANGDFNGADQAGIGLFQVTQRGGKRFSTARAFLDPIRTRANLTIRTGAHVTQVLFEGKRATGVEVRMPDGIQRLAARREVVLCGGAINSPQLLLLSGIGPRAELARHGIPLVHELPGIGQNLQDHLDVTVITKDQTGNSIGFAANTLPRALKAFFEYRKSGTGMFQSNAAEAGGFVCLTPESERPEIQFHFLPSLLRDHGRKRTWGHGMTLHCCQLRPRSRGHIGLKSADPFVDPLIEPNYLSHDDDVQELLAGLKLGRRIMSAPSMRAITGGVEFDPGPKRQSDAELIDFIRETAETIYHPVGTCKMGQDDMAVVDNRLRVHGVTGLRIADALIMPRVITGNTNAPTMVIGEKAARDIVADRNAPAAEMA